MFKELVVLSLITRTAQCSNGIPSFSSLGLIKALQFHSQHSFLLYKRAISSQQLASGMKFLKRSAASLTVTISILHFLDSIALKLSLLHLSPPCCVEEREVEEGSCCFFSHRRPRDRPQLMQKHKGRQHFHVVYANTTPLPAFPVSDVLTVRQGAWKL